MSKANDTTILIENVGKLYLLYDNIRDRVFDQLGLKRFFRWKKVNPREFWALRHIDLEIKQGERIGIIGRNGAGKSTLLKLLTQNFQPTEGKVTVIGSVQALMTTGSGFNPEFTGRENVHASLQSMGMSDGEIATAMKDIENFTELGQFLDQPFRNYSAGMQSRLTFAAATCLKPDILIIDEILGAGDAYFAAKSAERMKKLVEDTGATILLVSHDLLSVQRYCNQCLWLDRGKIIEKGSSINVCRSYEAFIRRLEETRINAKNEKMLQTSLSYEHAEGYGTYAGIGFRLPQNARLQVHKLTLSYGSEDLTILVGEPQDTDSSQQIYLTQLGGAWEAARNLPKQRVYFRQALATMGSYQHISANFWSLLTNGELTIEIHYTLESASDATLELELQPANGNTKQATFHIPPQTSPFKSHNISYKITATENRLIEESKWRGKGEADIRSVAIYNHKNEKSTTLEHGEAARISLKCTYADTVHEVTPCALIFTKDGTCITKFIHKPVKLNHTGDNQLFFSINIDKLLLDEGAYLLTTALYKDLDLDSIRPSEYFCVLDKSLEFLVRGTPLVKRAIFQHPATLSITTEQ